MSNFGIPLNDRPSIRGFSLLFDSFDLKSTWGPILEMEIDQKVCPINTGLCEELKATNDICALDFEDSLSSKNLLHFVQMSDQQSFQEFIETPSLYPDTQIVSDPIIPESYLGALSLYGIYAGLDE